MNHQIPAEGILKHNDWGDSKVYRVTCECGSSECDHNVWVEADDTGVNVTIYTTSRTNFWSQTRWYHIWTLLTKGYIDTQSTVCLKRQGALNYAETLKSAIIDVEDFRTERKEKSAVVKLAEQGDCT
jgi:hypothetical protein